MTVNHGAGNLARVLSVFEANDDYCHFTVSKTGVRNYLVRFLNEEQKLEAEMTVQLTYNIQPVDISFASQEDTARLGLRNTFMLTSMDEPETDKYWARRKKPKVKKSKSITKLGRMSKEVKATQLKSAKKLLATLV
jgi:hypothetical protein